VSHHKPHIVFVSHASGLCGAERSLLDLIKGIKGFTCTVLVPNRGPFVDVLLANNIPYKVVKYHAWVGRKHKPLQAVYRMFCNIYIAYQTAKFFRAHTVKAVYVNASTSPFGALLARWLKTPCVWHVREWITSFDFGMKRSLGFIQKNASMVVVNSEALRLQMASIIDAENITVVHNGPIGWAQMTDFQMLQKDSPSPQFVSLCVVGTIYPNKGFEDAVGALGSLVAQGLEVKLDILGDGKVSDVEQLKLLAKEQGVEGNIIWHGFVKEPLDILRAAHICLICSREEAFGRVAVEAMSVGTPVISTRVGGLVEIIQDKETGLFYEPRDIQTLASHIKYLANHPDVYRDIQKKGIEKVFHNFTTEQYQHRMKNVLSQVLQSEL